MQSLSLQEDRPEECICHLLSLLPGAAGTGLPKAELAFSKVFPRPQGVLARPISGRTGIAKRYGASIVLSDRYCAPRLAR